MEDVKQNNTQNKVKQQLQEENRMRWQKIPPTSTKVRLITQLPQIVNTGSHQQYQNHKKGKLKATSTISLQSFLNQPINAIRHKEQNVKEVYRGNALDSSLPTRNVGKHREIPKKKIPSKLKQNILKQESTQRPIETVDYCDNVINDELNEVTANFLKKIVTFQEHAFQKDPDKARIKKRYIVGFHESRKYILTRKIKLLVIAADMKMSDTEELLYKNITEIKDLAQVNEIPYVFALKRSKLGNLTMKYRPISCVGVLNYQSAEDEYNSIFNNLVRLNNDENLTDGNEDIYEEFLDKLKGAILQCDDN